MDNHAKGRVLVTIQFLLLAGIAFLTSNDLFAGNQITDYVGFALEVFGFAVVVIGFRQLGKSLTANPVPLKEGKLVVTGIYSRVRHPIYFGLLTVTLGMVVRDGAQIKLYFWLLLVALLTFKIKFEEALLVAKYPAYAEYKKEVPAILPTLKK